MEELDRAGITVTIDADDPALFGVTLLDEYELVAKTLGMPTAIRFARNGIDASFAPLAYKRRLHEAFDGAVASMPAGDGE